MIKNKDKGKIEADMRNILEKIREKRGKPSRSCIVRVEGKKFDGPDYSPKHDDLRLKGQIKRVFDCMKDGRWRTLDEISEITGDPAASISAQLRHLRKERFGSHIVDKRSRGERSRGLWEYSLTVMD